MNYIKKYNSPIGEIYLNSDGEYLKALCFKDSINFNRYIRFGEEKDLPIFDETFRWLDIYFKGIEPGFTPKFKIEDMTPFRKEVIEELLKIPFGHTITYNDIANTIAKRRGLKRMSAQAVGGAVGWNPICIIVPCHRVVGTNNNLTGYSGGIEKKIELLKIEGRNMDEFILPKKGIAL